jgi:hypothetical protein
VQCWYYSPPSVARSALTEYSMNRDRREVNGKSQRRDTLDTDLEVHVCGMSDGWRSKDAPLYLALGGANLVGDRPLLKIR